MSEYQYYEFLAIDRPLSGKEMRELRSISSRAEITPTHFSNEYSFGDLKADARKLLERYFDVFLYLANWGTRRLAVRMPRDAMPEDEIRCYIPAGQGQPHVSGEHIVVDLWSEEEGSGEWVEGTGWMPSLAGIRSELLRGDMRPLYLAWLLAVQNLDVQQDDEEPFVPPGLRSLSAPLQAMIEFLRIDEGLIAAAAEDSAEGVERADLEHWIADLPTAEKDRLLVLVVQGEHARVSDSLARRFKVETANVLGDAAGKRRTASQLLARADAIREAWAEERRRDEAEARRRRDALAAAARAERLDALAERKEVAWDEVERLVTSLKPGSYSEAAALLVDLRDLAQREGEQHAFVQRVVSIRERHFRKRTFIGKLNKAGLPA